MITGNTLVLTHWPLNDALIQTYTLPYVKIIRNHLSPTKKIWLQTLEKEKLSSSIIKEKKIELSNFGIGWIANKYAYYGFKAFLLSFYQIIYLVLFCYKNNIKIVHIWGCPIGVLGYIVSFLTGTKLIVDSYEPHAEPMVENGSWGKNSLKFKLLFYFEKRISKRASFIVSATKGMELYAKKKYDAIFENFFVKPACVDLSLFDYTKEKDTFLLKKLGIEEKIILLYAGKFGSTYLSVEVFEFCKIALNHFGPTFRFLILTSHKRAEIEDYCHKVGLDSSIVISEFVEHAKIAAYMGLADFAITPVTPVPTKRYCTPIKDGEYWAMGLPVVITKEISDDSEIIEEENIGAVLNELNEKEYLIAIKKIDSLLKTNRTELKNKIRKIAEKYRSFAIAEKVYSQIYK